MRRNEGGWRSSIHCSLLTILLGKYRFLSNTMQVQPVLCFASFLLCFRSPTQSQLVPSLNRVLLFSKDTVSFAACFQASTLSNFLRRGCYQICTCLRYRFSQFAQGRPSILPREMLKSDWLCYSPSLSTCCLEIFWTLPLARFPLPLIFSVSNYLHPDKLFLI